MASNIGVELEELNALTDSANYLYERGKNLTLRVSDETTVERDDFGSIKRRVPVLHELHAFPIIFNPTDEELLEAGIKENVDVLITLSTKHLNDLGITYDSIDTIRYEIDLANQRYTVKEKNQKNLFGYTYLNVILGLYRK